jgi:UDPglucose 6-dehydrogenase
VKIAEDAGYDFDLLSGVITVNAQQFDRVATKITKAAGGTLSDKTIAVWGLTFKARTDDLRESPSLEIVNRLLAAGARVVAHDPTVPKHRFGVPNAVELAASPVDACREADALCVLTEWDDYKDVSAESVAAIMRGRGVMDGRNLLDRSAWTSAGFDYQGIGR